MSVLPTLMLQLAWMKQQLGSVWLVLPHRNQGFVSYEPAWGHGCIEIFKLASGCRLEFLRKWYTGVPSTDADPWCIDFELMAVSSIAFAIEKALVKVSVFCDKSFFWIVSLQRPTTWPSRNVSLSTASNWQCVANDGVLLWIQPVFQFLSGFSHGTWISLNDIGLVQNILPETYLYSAVDLVLVCSEGDYRSALRCSSSSGRSPSLIVLALKKIKAHSVWLNRLWSRF